MYFLYEDVEVPNIQEACPDVLRKMHILRRLQNRQQYVQQLRWHYQAPLVYPKPTQTPRKVKKKLFVEIIF